MKKKVFRNQEDYNKYLEEKLENTKKIGAEKECQKDCKDTECENTEMHIAICSDGFHVYQENKTFTCQTGQQLINYLKTTQISKSQLLDLHESLFRECMKYEIDFPTDLT